MTSDLCRLHPDVVRIVSFSQAPPVHDPQPFLLSRAFYFCVRFPQFPDPAPDLRLPGAYRPHIVSVRPLCVCILCLCRCRRSFQDLIALTAASAFGEQARNPDNLFFHRIRLWGIFFCSQTCAGGGKSPGIALTGQKIIGPARNVAA